MNLNVLINLIGRSKQEIIRKLVLGPELLARFPKNGHDYGTGNAIDMKSSLE